MALDINNNTHNTLNNGGNNNNNNLDNAANMIMRKLNDTNVISDDDSYQQQLHEQTSNNNNDENKDLMIQQQQQMEQINQQQQQEVSKTNETISTNSSSSLLSSVIQSVHNQEAVEQLLRRTGYPLRQENGQRKYGPPPNWDPAMPEPDRGCEIFIGKIPRDCFEDEIVPLFERVGPLYEFRLMMEYSGYNRGYGFAMFIHRDDAKRAVAELNNYEIRKGKRETYDDLKLVSSQL